MAPFVAVSAKLSGNRHKRLCPQQADRDNEIIRDLTLEKMNTELCHPAAADEEQ